ncbi:hypothetical protein LTR62_002523 [Meristemomyces frigidus]|uniref:Uncharacterized protein n=1 Tax=Meristemomyces frigidus TaxID=1508187 RepID=A0AAN7TQW3_9PEZI|nr:hypothetical protein LTR62_002523 [Meristemomyces frigidus]
MTSASSSLGGYVPYSAPVVSSSSSSIEGGAVGATGSMGMPSASGNSTSPASATPSAQPYTGAAMVVERKLEYSLLIYARRGSEVPRKSP